MTDEQLLLLQSRRESFAEFSHNIIPTLSDFVEVMGIKPAALVATNAAVMLPYMHLSLQDLSFVEGKVKLRIVVGTGEYIGEYFRQKCGGSWSVDSDAESLSFAQYVVDGFEDVRAKRRLLAPFPIAMRFIDAGPSRDFAHLMREVESWIEER